MAHIARGAGEGVTTLTAIRVRFLTVVAEDLGSS